MNKKIAIVGIGNCGSQVAYTAEKSYPELFDCIYINTSEADLAMVRTENEDLKFKIGEEKVVEGSGKNRTKMKEHLMKTYTSILGNQKFQDTISPKKYIFIISSAAGGTGSGAAPVLTALMQQMFVDQKIILVGVLPQLGASLMEHGNELEFLDELYETLGKSITYMMYDNQTTSNLPPTKALEEVNKNIVEDIRVLTGADNFPTPYESIDDADMDNIVGTPERLLVIRINKGLTEKAMEDNQLDELIIKAIKNSCHAETDRNKKVVRWGIITYFTEEVNKLYDPELPKLREFLGTPIERFNHNAINRQSEDFNFLYLIASGLSPINDRVSKVTERVENLKNALASDDASKYILSGNSVSYDVIEERRRADKLARTPEKLEADAIFKKFMKS